MRYNHYSVQKASGIQRFAANLNAINYITIFRRQHRKLFRVIISIMIIAIAAVVILLFAGPCLNLRKNTVNTVSGDQIHAYEVIAENQAIIYYTASEPRNSVNIQIDFYNNGSFAFSNIYSFDSVPAGFQKLYLTVVPEINLYYYDLMLTL